MAKKMYDLCVRGREYKDKSGNIKNAWENIGSVIQGDKGPYMFLKRTFNPAGIDVEEGRESILVSMFEPKQNGSNAGYNDGNTYNDGSKGQQPQSYIDKDGMEWQKEPGKNWVKVGPVNGPQGDFKFADGPQGMGETPDIPF